MITTSLANACPAGMLVSVIAVDNFPELSVERPQIAAADLKLAGSLLEAASSVLCAGDRAFFAPYVAAVLALKKQMKAAVAVERNVGVEIGISAADCYDHAGELLRFAQTCPQSCIIVCGSRGLAESIALLCPQKRIIAVDSGNKVDEDLLTAGELAALREKYPNVPVVADVAVPLSLKALADYVTAEAEVCSLSLFATAERVIYLPDANVARSIAECTGKTLISWPSVSQVHDRFAAEGINKLREAYPNAFVVAHAACRTDARAAADGFAFDPLRQSPAESETILLIDDGAAVEAAHLKDPRVVLPEKRFRCRSTARITLPLLYAVMLQAQIVVLPEAAATAAQKAHAHLKILTPEPVPAPKRRGRPKKAEL